VIIDRRDLGSLVPDIDFRIISFTGRVITGEEGKRCRNAYRRK